MRAGKLTGETLYAELGDIVAGRKAGRESDEEKILFWHRGLSINDIALGQLYYEKALASNIGTKLFLQIKTKRPVRNVTVPDGSLVMAAACAQSVQVNVA